MIRMLLFHLNEWIGQASKTLHALSSLDRLHLLSCHVVPPFRVAVVLLYWQVLAMIHFQETKVFWIPECSIF